GVDVGDRVQIGSQAFAIRDVLLREPGRQVAFFNFGPRVLISRADLDKTGLIRFGSRVRYQILLQVPEGTAASLVRDLKEDLKGEFVSVRSFRETGDRIGRRLERTENYLSLAGFVIVILGGIGVWSVVRVFIQQKLKSIAILKCLGTSTRGILGIYLLEVMALGLAGSLLGVGLARLVLEAVPPGIGVDLEDVSYGLTASAVIQGLGIGLLVSLLFSLVPLLEVRRVRPLLLLRQGDAGIAEAHGASPQSVSLAERLALRLSKVDRVQWVAGGLVLLGLGVLASWQAGSVRVGLYVCAGFAGVSLALHLAGLGLLRAVAPLSRKAWFPLRHAVLSLTRPGNQTRVILLAVGLGCFFLLTMRGLQLSLLGQVDVEFQDGAPDMFLVDIQEDQEARLRERALSLGASRIKTVPVLRARVTGVEGRRVRLVGYEEVRQRGWLAREFVITYRDYLEPNERVIEGRFWAASLSSNAEVSIEESFREDFGIDVGDWMRFDIMGRELGARVTSVRQVEWSDARNGGFMLLFSPGALKGAPHTFVGFVKGPPEAKTRARFQRDLIADFHNVTIVDLHQILEDLAAVVHKVSLAVSLVAAVALLTGVLILVGSLAMTKFQRRYETAIFRTLGASKRNVAAMMLLEYGTLGTLAGVVGAAGALVLTWAMSRHVLEISWEPALMQNAAGIAIAALGVSAVGVFAILDVIQHKPLAILRAE
ncbi:MAG: ABC transporter permease, partial [Acidobacteriota bacterium]